MEPYDPDSESKKSESAESVSVENEAQNEADSPGMPSNSDLEMQAVKLARNALIFSLVGCGIGFMLSPILGVILGILGITSSRRASACFKSNLASGALFAGIAAIAISILNWGLNVVSILNSTV